MQQNRGYIMIADYYEKIFTKPHPEALQAVNWIRKHNIKAPDIKYNLIVLRKELVEDWRARGGKGNASDNESETFFNSLSCAIDICDLHFTCAENRAYGK